MLETRRLIVRDIVEDLYDGQVLGELIGRLEGFIQDILVEEGGGKKFVGHYHSVMNEYETIQIFWGEGAIPGPLLSETLRLQCCYS